MSGARAWAALAAAVVLGVAGVRGRPAAAEPAGTTIEPRTPAGRTVTQVDSRGPALLGRSLTNENKDRYVLKRSVGTMTLTAPTTNVGGNSRVVVAPVGEAPAADEEACATWTIQSDPLNQAGIALRVRATGGGRRSAVTVTKNVWSGAGWLFNVHVWNSRRTPAFTQIAQFDLSSAFRRRSGSPGPWRMCARVVGSRVNFSAWPLDVPRPAAADPRHGGAVRLPPGYDGPGLAGLFVGHLRPGDSVGFTHVVMNAVDPGPSFGPGAPGPREPAALASIS